MSEHVGWVPSRAGALFAALHRPDAPSRGTAVVIVSPFGWEAMSSARNLRGWARALAAAGYPTVRYHAAGTGDSHGEPAEQDLDTWAGSLADLLEHTRRATGCSRLTVIGLGMGGLVAATAISAGAEVDELVLWSTPVKGRLLLRELRAFARLTSEPGDGASGDPAPEGRAPEGRAPEGRAPEGRAPEGRASEGPASQDRAHGDRAESSVVEQDGVLWVHGYPLSARAQQQLTDLDLASLDLSGVQRSLVLGRGTLPPDARLIAALAAAGSDVGSGHGPGYDELTVEPRLSELPTAVMALVLSWLTPAAPQHELGAWAVATTAESLVSRGPASIIAHPAPDASLTAVFVGAGATPRSGPNRLWAEASRRWAEWGIASVRVDLEGIGEAAGPDAWGGSPEAFYVEGYRSQVRSVLDAAVELGLPSRFLLVGLCSGGYWAAQQALEDPRVDAVIILNTVELVWPPPLAPLSPRERLHHLTRKATWEPILRDKVVRQDVLGRVRRSGRQLAARVRPARPQDGRRPPETSLQVLQALDRSGVRVDVGVSPGEPMIERLAGMAGPVTTRVTLFGGPAGAHTLSPLVLRTQAEQLLDRAAQAALVASS